MKRFMSLWAALPLVSCGNGFFITLDLSLDTRDTGLIAVDLAEVREIEVQATPDNGDAPVTFTIQNVPRFPPEGFLSYALELPKELENVPLQLVHRAFSTDPNITEPFLFAATSVTTEPNFRNGVLLGAKDPACNNAFDGEEFCFGSPVKGNVNALYTKILATNVLAPGGPIIMVASDNINNVLAFSVSVNGLQPISNLGFPYPDLSPLTDIALLDSDNTNQFVSVALLQNNQIIIRLPNGIQGVDFPANGSKKIVGIDLSLPVGRDIAAITDTSAQVFLSSTGAAGFDAPIVLPIPPGFGLPTLLKTRKVGNLEQFCVLTQGGQLLTFDFDPSSNQIRQLANVPLLPGVQIASFAIADINGDNLEDAVIADNGSTKRLLLLLLDDSGSLLPGSSITEIPVSGNQIQEVSVGRFDNNASLDFAVSGERGQNFVQFILSSDNGPKVTAPRTVAGGAGTILPVKLNTQNQADTVLVETNQVDTLDILAPEL